MVEWFYWIVECDWYVVDIGVEICCDCVVCVCCQFVYQVLFDVFLYVWKVVVIYCEDEFDIGKLCVEF